MLFTLLLNYLFLFNFCENISEAVLLSGVAEGLVVWRHVERASLDELLALSGVPLCRLLRALVAGHLHQAGLEGAFRSRCQDFGRPLVVSVLGHFRVDDVCTGDRVVVAVLEDAVVEVGVHVRVREGQLRVRADGATSA